jgi:NhaP-type Na+/H+ or K+/H+ antiporter
VSNQLLVVYLTIVPLLGVLAQWLAWRLRLPSILLLLAFGVILGQFIVPDDLLSQLTGSDPSAAARLLFPVVSLSVAIILFEGGLTLRLRELREAGNGVLRLVTIGALISWGLGSLAAWWMLGFSPGVAALLGAVLIVTGPTVVAPILRSIRPTRRVSSLVKWEGIVIDPIGAVLAVLVFDIVFAQHTQTPLVTTLGLLATTLAVGFGIGALTAWALIQWVKRYWLPDYLHGVVFLVAAMGSFTLSNILRHESGLVTVTVLGVLLANQRSISIRHVIEFKEHLGVFLISCLFIVLGSRLEPRQLWDLGWGGLGFVAAMILVVRPAAIFLSQLGSDLKWNERAFLACLAPRGIVAAAVSSVFALELAAHYATGDAGEMVSQANRVVPVTFLVIVCTVAIYGLSAAPLASWLRLADAKPQGILFSGAEDWIREIANLLKESGFQVMLVDTNYSHVAHARMDGLPAECASILSEHVQEEMDLSGIGRLLATTPNDEVNALSVAELTHVFGRENVFQLKPSEAGSPQRQLVSEHLRGRQLFRPSLTHEDLLRRLESGSTIKRTNLTDEFPYAAFEDRYGDSVVLLFLIDSSGNLKIATSDGKQAPQPGQTIIALVDDVEGSSREPSESIG